jgi:hypothetical protein
MGSITYQGLISRLEAKTQTTSSAFANWTSDRKLEQINEGVFQTFKMLVQYMPWDYFVDVAEGIVPAANTINLDALPKAYYGLLAFSKYPYSEGCDVNVRSMRDVHTNRHIDEGWYELNRVLRSDMGTALAGPYRLVYTYKPPRVSSNEIATPCPIDDEYVDLPVLWAAMECYSDAGFNDNYLKLLSQWERRSGELQKTAAKRNAAQTIRVIDKMGWGRRNRGWPRVWRV